MGCVVQLSILICLVVGSEAFGLGRKQSSGARGQVVCNGKPYPDALIKLYDDDRGIDSDDLMGITRDLNNPIIF
jgi:hypothetical protein